MCSTSRASYLYCPVAWVDWQEFPRLFVFCERTSVHSWIRGYAKNTCCFQLNPRPLRQTEVPHKIYPRGSIHEADITTDRAHWLPICNGSNFDPACRGKICHAASVGPCSEVLISSLAPVEARFISECTPGFVRRMKGSVRYTDLLIPPKAL